MKYTDRNFFKTILQLSNSDSASGTYCRILCKPDGWQHYFRYPLAWDPPWQSTFFTGAWVDTLALAYSWLVWLPSWYRRPIVNRLRASGRNWFRTIIMMVKNKSEFCAFSFVTLCWAVKCGWSCMQMNIRETSNVAGNWCWQWTITDLIWCDPPCPLNSWSLYVLTVTVLVWPWCRRNRVRETAWSL